MAIFFGNRVQFKKEQEALKGGVPSIIPGSKKDIVNREVTKMRTPKAQIPKTDTSAFKYPFPEIPMPTYYSGRYKQFKKTWKAGEEAGTAMKKASEMAKPLNIVKETVKGIPAAANKIVGTLVNRFKKKK